MRRGTEIRERCSYPSNTIFNMGIPRVSDLCVAQNMMATVSAGVKPDCFCVEKTNVNSMKLSWMQNMMKVMSSKLRWSSSISGLEKVSQKVV